MKTISLILSRFKTIGLGNNRIDLGVKLAKLVTGTTQLVLKQIFPNYGRGFWIMKIILGWLEYDVNDLKKMIESNL